MGHLTLGVTEQGRLARCPSLGLEAQLAVQPGAWHAPPGDCNQPPLAYDRDYHQSSVMASLLMAGLLMAYGRSTYEHPHRHQSWVMTSRVGEPD